MSEVEKDLTETATGTEAADVEVRGTEADDQAVTAPDATHENTGA